MRSVNKKKPVAQMHFYVLPAIANNVFVSWWESNPIHGSSESVPRVSTDGGKTFGPLLMLTSNSTNISSGEGVPTETSSSAQIK
jgi:hypothetical protein